MNRLAQKGFCCLLICFAGAARADWKIEWRPHSDRAGSRVIFSGGSTEEWRSIQNRSEGWTATDWSQSFPVYLVIDGSSLDLPPVSGSYHLQSAPAPALLFQPRFPWANGATYRAIIRLNENKAPIESLWTQPAKKRTPETRVVAIFPTAPQIPENLLKFYIQFSHPMRRGGIYQYIHLKNASGVEIEDPFLEVDEELWDPDRLRLTLFIDPGRVKRGVRPLEEVGPALEAGKRYTLSVDSDWLDENGAPLVADFIQEFEVVGPDRLAPDPEEWEYCFPASGLKLPVRVEFGESLDQALASARIRVFDKDRMLEIRGTTRLLKNESIWEFTPDQAWQAGDYFLLISHKIEDLAGNQIGKPFEVSLTDPESTPVDRTDVRKYFEIR